MKEKFQYFRFWLASKIIMLSVSVIDKNTFEGISLAMALEGWTKELVNRVHYEKMIETNNEIITNSNKEKKSI